MNQARIYKTKMRKFSNITYNGASRWIELCDDCIYFMVGEPQYNQFIRGEIADLDYDQLNYLSPSIPSKVIGVGWNYKDLVGEQDVYPEPIVFLKSPTSICAHDTKIKFPNIVEKVWVEVELVIVIGRECSNVAASEAHDYILGHTIGSDITALNIHDRDWHLARSKAFDDFAPIGPFLITGLNTENLALKSTINGREAQVGNTSSRILNDNELIALISSMMTLMPGDVIFTGTPARATEALVCPGDHIKHEIENLGDLRFEII